MPACTIFLLRLYHSETFTVPYRPASKSHTALTGTFDREAQWEEPFNARDPV